MSYYFQQFLYNIYEYSNYYNIPLIINILYRFDVYNEHEDFSPEQENIIKQNFINEIEKHTSFSTLPIKKDITLSVDHNHRCPLGLYYIKDDDCITKLNIFKYGEDVEISKYEKGTLYYTDNIKAKTKGKLSFESVSPSKIISWGIILLLLVASFFSKDTLYPAYIIFLLFAVLAEILDNKNNKRKKCKEKEDNILSIGKMLNELSLNYKYLFTYTKYTYSYEETKHILENKFEILKTHPMLK